MSNKIANKLKTISKTMINFFFRVFLKQSQNLNKIEKTGCLDKVSYSITFLEHSLTIFTDQIHPPFKNPEY